MELAANCYATIITKSGWKPRSPSFNTPASSKTPSSSYYVVAVASLVVITTRPSKNNTSTADTSARSTTADTTTPNFTIYVLFSLCPVIIIIIIITIAGLLASYYSSTSLACSSAILWQFMWLLYCHPPNNNLKSPTYKSAISRTLSLSLSRSTIAPLHARSTRNIISAVTAASRSLHRAISAVVTTPCNSTNFNIISQSGGDQPAAAASKQVIHPYITWRRHCVCRRSAVVLPHISQSSRPKQWNFSLF